MYVRKQLSRKRTADREVLSMEHQEDVSKYRETTFRGAECEADIEKITALINDVSQNETLSAKEKEPILQQLNLVLDELNEEYSEEITNKQVEIECSIQERIDELEAAKKERETEVYLAESTVWKTDAVDKERLVLSSKELFRKYEKQLEDSNMDLRQLTKESEEQRIRIKAYRNKH